MNWTREQYEAYESRRKPSRAQPEPGAGNALAGPAQGGTQDAGCFVVRITSYRVRLIDDDACVGKWFVDALRYSGLLPGDSVGQLDFQIRQSKVPSKSFERTEIEITPP